MRSRRVQKVLEVAVISLVLPLVTPAPALGLALERTGEVVAAGGRTGLLSPAALWYDGVRDVLAVACPNAHRVLLMDRKGEVLKEIGSGGEIQFPRAVAGTRDGKLYVASWESESLAVFGRYATGAGEAAQTLDLSSHRGAAPVRPASLFVDGNGDVYVADRGNRQVIVLGGDGKPKRIVRNVGEPADLWVDRGTLYVAEPVLGGVRVYDERGKHLRTLGTSPSQFREPIRPRALALDRSGRIWILEEGNRGLKALDAFGNLLFSMAGDAFFAPVDLAIDPRDTLYVLEEGGNRIAVFRISGA